MNSEVAKLEQLLDSTFGLAFLTHLLGLDAHQMQVGEVSPGEIAWRAESFSPLSLERPLFEVFAEFIRDFPMGMQRDWILLAAELVNAKQALSTLLTRISPELLELGFAACFDESMQFAVDVQERSLDVLRETNWKSSRDAWWTTPNTLVTFQGRSSEVKQFAFDDAMMMPRSMTHVSFAVKPKVLEIATVQDWLRLVDKFPIEAKVLYLENWKLDSELTPDWVWIPDWSRIAREYAGVYLSAAAYLGASYRLLTSPYGRASLLSGWSPGATYWLPQGNF